MEEINLSVGILRNDSAHKDAAITLSLDHARKLFKRQHKRGTKFFSLAKNSPYKISKTNGDLITNTSERNTDSAKGKGGSPESKKA